MKKLILHLSLFFTLLIALYAFPQNVGHVNAQTKGPIGCEELKSILGSKECPTYIMNIENRSLWCAQSNDQLVASSEEGATIELFKGRPPDYLLDSSLESCYEETSEGKNEIGQPQKTEETTEQQPSEKKTRESGPKSYPKQEKGTIDDRGRIPVFIGEWFRAVMGSIYFNNWAMDTASLMMGGQTAEGRRGTARDLKYIEDLPEEYVHYATGYRKDHFEDMLEREPQISDDIVKQLKQKVQDSPFRSDILDGQVQIKYPGQHTWADLKQGDKIPPGSTIFTGMDTTTVLSIKDKGVLEILPFTEVTVSEEGLEEAAAQGKTSTEINLKKGEVEVKVEGGVYLPSLQVTTPNGVAGVRGTHFWVSYNDKANATIYGVYEGEVEIKSRGSDKPMLISPNGDKPGVVVIAQKLSVIKLAVAGLVIVVVLIGVILFVRKRFALKRRGKRR